jgi:hypothetical protein
MKVSTRESVMGMITVSVGLFAATAFLAGSRIEAWQNVRAQQAQVANSIERSKALVEQQEKWTTRMSELQGLIPRFPQSKRMDVYWSGEMEKKAAKHGLKILRHEVGSELQEGLVYELPIECRDWSGSLDALVHFLFDLQSEGAMLDIRYLRIKPKDKVTRTGRFSLYCAYMREGA